MKTDRITVYKGSSTSGNNRFSTSIEFFKQEFVRHISDDQIIFKIVPLDWASKIHKCRRVGDTYHGHVPLYILPGDYYVNWEESTEDRLIFDI